MRIPDTNILLNTANQDSPHHTSAKRWIEDALSGGESTGFAWLALVGFVRISTLPRVFATPLDAENAIELVEEWLGQPHAGIVEPPKEGHPAEIRRLLTQAGTGGNLTSDAHLAAIAIHHSATLVSFDSDFKRFDGLRFEQLS